MALKDINLIKNFYMRSECTIIRRKELITICMAEDQVGMAGWEWEVQSCNGIQNTKLALDMPQQTFTPLTW